MRTSLYKGKRKDNGEWEAAAMNSACFRWLSSTGFKDQPTKYQLIADRPATPRSSSAASHISVVLSAAVTGGT